MILNIFPNVKFVPFCHSNTSSLDSPFSLMQFYGADTTARYEHTFNIDDKEKSMDMMASNNMYERNADYSIDDSTLTGKRYKPKKMMIVQYEKIRECKSFVLAFDTNPRYLKITWIDKLWIVFKENFIFGSYKEN